MMIEGGICEPLGAKLIQEACVDERVISRLILTVTNEGEQLGLRRGNQRWRGTKEQA